MSKMTEKTIPKLTSRNFSKYNDQRLDLIDQEMHRRLKPFEVRLLKALKAAVEEYNERNDPFLWASEDQFRERGKKLILERQNQSKQGHQ